jgi:hypothetical protein
MISKRIYALRLNNMATEMKTPEIPPKTYNAPICNHPPFPEKNPIKPKAIARKTGNIIISVSPLDDIQWESSHD